MCNAIRSGSSRLLGWFRPCEPPVRSIHSASPTAGESERELSDKQNGSQHHTTKAPWREWASELYRPSDRRLSAKLLPTFADTGRHVVNMMDPYGRILGFIDSSRYFFFQVAPQLYSRGWVDPVPDPLLRKSSSAGNITRTSGAVPRNSDH
jgi:hypothetical protein